MKINITVKIRQKKSELIKESDKRYTAKIKNIPVENKANLEIIYLVANYFKIPKSEVTISSGIKSKSKTIDINIQK